MQAVIRECCFPLAAPSANLSNELSPTNASHVQKSLRNKIHLIVDGGQSQIGIESTVLDLTATPPRLLRPGMIHEEALLAVTGALTVGSGDGEEILKSPGQLQKHYSPRAKLVVCSWQDDEDLKSQIPNLKSQISNLQVIAHTHIPSSHGFARVSIIPHDPEAFGRALYAELHQCDEAGADLIIVEAVPESHEWRAIADRLKRAAS
jgi:L-threonylcarbamoyladenylate synthase